MNQLKGQHIHTKTEALEQALLQRGEDHDCCQHGRDNESYSGPTEPPNVVQILSTLAAELQKLNSKPQRRVGDLHADTRHSHSIASPVGSQASSRHTIERHEGASQHSNGARKRRRVDSCGNPHLDLSHQLEESLESFTTSLPQAELLEEVLIIYFDIIQPWIPILHETQFRRRVQDPAQLPQLVLILHAMVVAALRFVEISDTRLSAQNVEKQMTLSRRFVVLNSMDSLSVENLQALIIIAFNDVRVILFIEGQSS